MIAKSKMNYISVLVYPVLQQGQRKIIIFYKHSKFLPNNLIFTLKIVESPKIVGINIKGSGWKSLILPIGTNCKPLLLFAGIQNIKW
ncbi:MAG: hypothetical protein DHS20C18_50570 [Saprospiraceae bacterium]|nr:MAG: hypothetical protein DHS20C18_50570 [Saprospiraceae bacterium]